jgi:DNA-directed RNA polymerase subunit M/transcription elongation factor TFIIS
MSAEEDFDIEEDLDEEEEVEDLDEEEEDLDGDEDAEDLDGDEDAEEEEEVEEEEDVEVEEEEVEDIEADDDVEEEEEEDAEEDEEEELSFKDIYQDDEPVRATKKQKARMDRYCKSLNETNPREVIAKECMPSEAFTVLKQLTTEKNAIAFSSHISSKRELYSICGKMITKELPNKQLYQEVKSGIDPWNSEIYKRQKTKEQMEIRILTTKMDVVEGLYKCKRCSSQKTYSRQVQTRSADEGMTSIIQCSKCHLVWREYA